MSENTDNRTATQRLEDLERVVASMYQALGPALGQLEALGPVKNELELVKEVLKLLNKRVEATIQLAKPETGITSDAVSAAMAQMAVAEMAGLVKGWLDSGALTTTDTVTDQTFLVCRELNSDGVEVNPRVQFRLDSQDQVTQDALRGNKAGVTVSFGENRFSVQILEIYALTQPKAPEAAPSATEAPPAAETAPEASAEAPAAAPAEEAPAPATSTAPTPVPAQATLDPLPPESPVVEFVPSQSDMMLKA